MEKKKKTFPDARAFCKQKEWAFETGWVLGFKHQPLSQKGDVYFWLHCLLQCVFNHVWHQLLVWN